LTTSGPYTIMEFDGQRMKTIASFAVFACLSAVPVAQAQDATPAQPAAAGQSSSSLQPAQDDAASSPAHSDSYYYFTLGHMQEQQYEASGRAELATQAIDSYKKALALTPDSTVIMERLAEIYAKSQRTREASAEAQAVLKIDPDDVNAHKLLARIYVRALSDAGAGEAQKENLAKAVEQFQAILKVQPDDTYSALWLARLYRFENKHDDAEKVLRATVNRDPANGAALEQLSQLLVDEGRSQEAITLLTQAAGDSASPDTYDLLGDAYAQSKEYAKSEDAYRKAVAEDPDDPAHVHGLAQALMSQEKFVEALEQYKRLSELEPSTWENMTKPSQRCCARNSFLLTTWNSWITRRCCTKNRGVTTTL
jgi:tetratricopeptide (TPR) repeat protein